MITEPRCDNAASQDLTLSSLTIRPIWVAWQTENRKDGKPTKVPYAPDGRKAKADDPSTWGNRSKAEARAAILPKPYKIGAWRERVAGDDTYARRLIQRQLVRVASAQPGSRHDTLRAASKVIGGILDLDEKLTHSQVARQLFHAIKDAGGEDVVDTNAQTTIEWALQWGKARPLTLRGDNG